MRLRWRQVRRLVRWHSVLFPLFAAGVAAVVTVVPMVRGGNQWCNASAFSCSVDTNLLGVVLVGGVTSYWYYGFRRALLLARHRRAVLARLREAGPPGEDLAVRYEAHDAVVNAVLSRYRGWRNQPPVTVIAGLPGSGKTVFLADVVRRLAASRSWYVPVPLEDVAGGGEQDILDAAQRQLEMILHDASINPGLIDALYRSLTRSRRLMIVIDDIDRIGPELSSYERTLIVQRLTSIPGECFGVVRGGGSLRLPVFPQVIGAHVCAMRRSSTDLPELATAKHAYCFLIPHGVPGLAGAAKRRSCPRLLGAPLAHAVASV